MNLDKLAEKIDEIESQLSTLQAQVVALGVERDKHLRAWADVWLRNRYGWGIGDIVLDPNPHTRKPVLFRVDSATTSGVGSASSYVFKVQGRKVNKNGLVGEASYQSWDLDRIRPAKIEGTDDVD